MRHRSTLGPASTARSRCTSSPSPELITEGLHRYLYNYLIKVFLAYQALCWMRSGTMLRVSQMSEKGSKGKHFLKEFKSMVSMNMHNKSDFFFVICKDKMRNYAERVKTLASLTTILLSRNGQYRAHLQPPPRAATLADLAEWSEHSVQARPAQPLPLAHPLHKAAALPAKARRTGEDPLVISDPINHARLIDKSKSNLFPPTISEPALPLLSERTSPFSFPGPSCPVLCLFGELGCQKLSQISIGKMSVYNNG